MNYKFYNPCEILSILERNQTNAVFCKEKGKDGKTKSEVLNTPISFDIETTSTYISGRPEKKEKRKFAFMYAWAFDIYDTTIIGRTWDEFSTMIQKIVNFYKLNDDRRIIIFIHNLAFEFTFIQYLFEWKHVFATEPRKPIYAVTQNGIEFRCSLRLTGYALDTVGKQLGIEKLDGKKYDYSKIRHFATPLESYEIQYIIHDAKIVSECIRQKIKDENGIIFIPLTKTGYVRRLFRYRCLHDRRYNVEYMEMISRLTLTLDEYKLAKSAFCGGFTHANPRKSGKVEKNVESIDLCSSYPTSLIAFKYPMSKGKFYRFQNKRHFRKEMYNPNAGYIVQVELTDIKPKFLADNYISYSKCKEVDKAVKNNGRIVYADRIVIDITNIDFQIIDECYEFKIKGIGECYRYDMDYLPKPFIETLLELYAKKTTLKDVDGMEKEYLNSKENINASFGMCVMSIIRDLIDFDIEWNVNGKPQKDYAHLTDDEMLKQLEKDNKSKGRFLSFLWGTFCTAYSRYRLWKEGILICGFDYLYADTDSIKMLNAKKYRNHFENANNKIIAQIENVLRMYNLPLDSARPKTKDGIEKPLGIWEFDGHYAEFKTIGAKRYFFRYSDDKRNKEKNRGKYVLTCAGLSKKDALEYILTKKNPFAFFRNGMRIPEENTGKLTHTYIDEITQGTITDYKGITKTIISLSAVHLSKQDYHLSLARDYADFLKGKHDYFTK